MMNWWPAHEHGGSSAWSLVEDDPIHINKGFSFFFPLGSWDGGWWMVELQRGDEGVLN